MAARETNGEGSPARMASGWNEGEEARVVRSLSRDEKRGLKPEGWGKTIGTLECTTAAPMRSRICF